MNNNIIESNIFQNSTFYVVYDNWYCGTTNNPIGEKNTHKSKNGTTPFMWKHYSARSVRIALAI